MSVAGPAEGTSVSARPLLTYAHEPGWAAGIADLADRAAAVFASAGVEGCLTVVDLEPTRLLDAWWLRRRLEPLSKLSGRSVRYVPCTGCAGRLQAPDSIAPAWSVGTLPAELSWQPQQSAPVRKGTSQGWEPEGPVLLLAGGLAQDLRQDLLLAHHGRIHDWAGPPNAREWQKIDVSRYDDWIAEGIRGYAVGLPSSMFSLPVGYWQFIERAMMGWATRGCIVVARAEGWTSLAQIRDDAAVKAKVSAERPPVNFHWLAQHAPRLQAVAHDVRTARDDTIQILARGLPGGAATLLPLCASLAAGTRSNRAGIAQAIRALAAAGEIEAVLAVLQQSADDPTLLHAFWEPLVPAAAAANPALRARLATWLEHVMADNPWISDDADLLRAAGHLALACDRPGLARTALQILHEKRRATAPDFAVLARAHEEVGALRDAISACDLATANQSNLVDAMTTRSRVSARIASLHTPWKMQHASDTSPLMLDPLHEGHAAMLARQIRDPAILAMTVLPAFDEKDDGTAWIRGRLNEGGAAYAIMHRHRGFLGSLELRIRESTAFLSCWIGADHQGFGYYAPVLALARDVALANGIDVILSAAFDDNVRSLRGLAKCGFRKLPVRALAPDADRTFVVLSARPIDDEEAERRLVDFCTATSSGLRFANGAAAAKSEPQLSGETP
jgi:RimJ/RimL family protein N-acetyltransferase